LEGTFFARDTKAPTFGFELEGDPFLVRHELKLRDTGGSQTKFQNAEKELLDHNWTTHYFKDIVPYHNFANTSPPKTASPILRRVPIRKYSANRSFNSGNLAIDFPVRISPTIEGD